MKSKMESEVIPPPEISENSPEDLEKDKAELTQYVEDFEKRLQQKVALNEKNTLISKSRPDPSFLSKLDSSLKKNTAFIKRLRNFTASQLDVFVRDLSGLNLSKYLSEVASSLTEVKLKITDIPAVIQLCSQIHCSYAEFSTIFHEQWIKTLHFKKNDSIENVSKLRVDLRFYGDLIISGIFPAKESLPLLGTVLTFLTHKDKENHHNVNIIISFCKHCGEDFAGLVQKRIRKLSDRFGIEIPRSSLLALEKQNNVKALFVEYHSSLCQHILKDQAKVVGFERQNEHVLRLKGEVRGERLVQAESMRVEFQALLTSAETLAELLDQPMPVLPSVLCSHHQEKLPSEVDPVGTTPDEGLWEDDEAKAFYQVFPDLHEYLPNHAKPVEPPASTITEEKLDEEIKEEDLDIEEGTKEDEILNVEEPEETGSTSIKQALEAFLNNLPTCINREMIDNAAVEFVVFLNTKTSRRKLIKALFGVPRTRLDLLPFYGRLVAILNPVIPEISTNLTNLLKQDFKYHIKKKDQINLESKIKVSRYIGELVKFGLFPTMEVLYCLKLLLHDFSHHHIEMACNILETCGRYLYRTPETHARTKIYLDDMMRLKSVVVLDIRYTNMIENAFYFVNPPDNAIIIKKKRPPLHDFVRKLIFQDLMYIGSERKVLRLLRCIQWDDDSVAGYAIKCLSSAWQIKFHRIPALADLVASLVEYQEFVGTKVVDSVLEDIRLGMELNTVRMNQRRVAMVKYFGELYNYRLLESADIFRVLYSLITFGVTMNHQLPSSLDLPDNLIRIRLVCTLLDTCGKFLSHSDMKTKLPYFFNYFQCYFWFKKSSPVWNDENKFPVYAQYQLEDCLEKNCPNVTIYTSLLEAQTAVKKLQDKILSEYDYKQDSSSNMQTIYTAPISINNDESIILEEDEDETGDENDESINEDKEKVSESNDDKDFLVELEKMVYDNVQERLKESVRPTQEIVVPFLGKTQKTKDADSSFVLLLRKGNKTQCKSLDVPADSDLVKNLKHREEAERQEKEKVKKLTLDIQRMQLEDSLEPQQDTSIPPSNTNHQRRIRCVSQKGEWPSLLDSV